VEEQILTADFVDYPDWNDFQVATERISIEYRCSLPRLVGVATCTIPTLLSFLSFTNYLRVTTFVIRRLPAGRFVAFLTTFY